MSRRVGTTTRPGSELWKRWPSQPDHACITTPRRRPLSVYIEQSRWVHLEFNVRFDGGGLLASAVGKAIHDEQAHWAAKVSTASSLRTAVRRSSVCVSLAALLLPTLSWGQKPTNAQALRTCVDRWESGQHARRGPWAGERSLPPAAAKEHSSIQVSLRHQCIVATAAGDGTRTGVLSSTVPTGVGRSTSPPGRA